MIRVLVADDHAVVRRGVAGIVNDAPGMVTAGEASTGRQVLMMLAQDAESYDVLILDIDMPEGDGLEVLAQLQGQPDTPAVVILSIYPEKQFALRALQAGAVGYLTKESIPQELVAAIRQAAQGARYITQSLADVLADHVAAGLTPYQALSDREFQVLRLMGAGLRRKEIAVELNLSVKTISTYRARILEKLNLHTTADIVRYAVEHDLVG
ncbi:MAG: response regulator transcription factor [Anaerolineae bacterium]|nr:response regulator transcription factor [Anaerolineae bacterium]